jgi:hypothetical protein
MEHHNAPQPDESRAAPLDAQIDALLDEALSFAGDAAEADALVRRVLDATAPQAVERAKAHAWLDAALALHANEAPPATLVQRIVKASGPALFRRRRPVLAFLGSTPAYRAAAVVLLAAMLGIWATLASIVVSARDIVQVQSQVARLDQVTALADVELPIDAQIASLEKQLAQLETRGLWSSDDLAIDAADGFANPAAGSDPAALF